MLQMSDLIIGSSSTDTTVSKSDDDIHHTLANDPAIYQRTNKSHLLEECRQFKQYDEETRFKAMDLEKNYINFLNVLETLSRGQSLLELDDDLHLPNGEIRLFEAGRFRRYNLMVMQLANLMTRDLYRYTQGKCDEFRLKFAWQDDLIFGNRNELDIENNPQKLQYGPDKSCYSANPSNSINLTAELEEDTQLVDTATKTNSEIFPVDELTYYINNNLSLDTDADNKMTSYFFSSAAEASRPACGYFEFKEGSKVLSREQRLSSLHQRFVALHKGQPKSGNVIFSKYLLPDKFMLQQDPFGRYILVNVNMSHHHNPISPLPGPVKDNPMTFNKFFTKTPLSPIAEISISSSTTSSQFTETDGTFDNVKPLSPRTQLEVKLDLSFLESPRPDSGTVFKNDVSKIPARANSTSSTSSTSHGKDSEMTTKQDAEIDKIPDINTKISPKTKSELRLNLSLLLSPDASPQDRNHTPDKHISKEPVSSTKHSSSTSDIPDAEKSIIKKIHSETDNTSSTPVAMSPNTKAELRLDLSLLSSPHKSPDDLPNQTNITPKLPVILKCGYNPIPLENKPRLHISECQSQSIFISEEINRNSLEYASPKGNTAAVLDNASDKPMVKVHASGHPKNTSNNSKIPVPVSTKHSGEIVSTSGESINNKDITKSTKSIQTARASSECISNTDISNRSKYELQSPPKTTYHSSTTKSSKIPVPVSTSTKRSLEAISTTSESITCKDFSNGTKSDSRSSPKTASSSSKPKSSKIPVPTGTSTKRSLDTISTCSECITNIDLSNKSTSEVLSPPKTTSSSYSTKLSKIPVPASPSSKRSVKTMSNTSESKSNKDFSNSIKSDLRSTSKTASRSSTISVQASTNTNRSVDSICTWSEIITNKDLSNRTSSELGSPFKTASSSSTTKSSKIPLPASRSTTGSVETRSSGRESITNKDFSNRITSDARSPLKTTSSSSKSSKIPVPASASTNRSVETINTCSEYITNIDLSNRTTSEVLLDLSLRTDSGSGTQLSKSPNTKSELQLDLSLLSSPRKTKSSSNHRASKKNVSKTKLPIPVTSHSTSSSDFSPKSNHSGKSAKSKIPVRSPPRQMAAKPDVTPTAMYSLSDKDATSQQVYKHCSALPPSKSKTKDKLVLEEPLGMPRLGLLPPINAGNRHLPPIQHKVLPPIPSNKLL